MQSHKNRSNSDAELQRISVAFKIAARLFIADLSSPLLVFHRAFLASSTSFKCRNRRINIEVCSLKMANEIKVILFLLTQSYLSFRHNLCNSVNCISIPFRFPSAKAARTDCKNMTADIL